MLCFVFHKDKDFMELSGMERSVPLFENEPPSGGWGDVTLFDELLRWAVVDQRASDIKMTPNGPIYLSVRGGWYPVTRRSPSVPELSFLVDTCSRRANASSRVLSGTNENYAYETTKVLNDRRSGTWRFRSNATSCLFGRDKGISLTMRAIPDKIPALPDLGVDTSLFDYLMPKHGIISISGVMGSGKTTTMAAIMQEIRTKTRRSLMTLEDPIEFDLTTIPNSMGPIEQIEVPTMISSFKEGIVSATRKAVNSLLVGETNKNESMSAMIEAGEVGIGVYHTLHTKSVSAIPGRIIHMFEHEEAAGIAASYLSSIQVMLQQRLVPRPDGERTALREWLVLDDAMREQLINTPVERLQPVLEKMVREKGRHLIDEARAAYANGLISKLTLTEIEIERL
jgi:defect-in-organelle-trafficking protein DotB